jgi:hypothetical protein
MFNHQLHGLADLAAFLKANPTLPVLGWYVDEAGDARAMLTGSALDQAPKILAAYAAALGVNVQEEDARAGRRLHSVQGRIGPALHQGAPPRSIIVVTAEA